MNDQRQHMISAFTIFEVTIVLAIMSVIVSMVTFSVNRLFDQMRVSEEIHAELNNFYKVRSTLWYDCISADSVVYSNNSFTTYYDNCTVRYSIEEEELIRNQNGIRQPLMIAVKNIASEELEEGDEIVVTFDWKGEELPWRFFNLPNIEHSINQFFDERDG